MASKNLKLFWELHALVIWCVAVGVFPRTNHVVSAFLGQKSRFVSPTVARMPHMTNPLPALTVPSVSVMTLSQSLSSNGDTLSSADVDSDEDAEQRLGNELDSDSYNGIDDNEFLVADGTDRWQGLLASTGLEGKLRHVTELPSERKISTFDIFCNRELKMDNLAAIGFDMDYTLARYQQPAFDKLAFDGAKEKLVSKLG